MCFMLALQRDKAGSGWAGASNSIRSATKNLSETWRRRAAGPDNGACRKVCGQGATRLGDDEGSFVVEGSSASRLRRHEWTICLLSVTARVERRRWLRGLARRARQRRCLCFAVQECALESWPWPGRRRRV
jgi:hypothetical protein